MDNSKNSLPSIERFDPDLVADSRELPVSVVRTGFSDTDTFRTARLTPWAAQSAARGSANPAQGQGTGEEGGIGCAGLRRT